MKKPIKLGTFVNGNEYCQHHFIEAEALLRRAGVYRTLGNFGPYEEEKRSRLPYVQVVEVRIEGDYEYTIVEAVGMSLGGRSAAQREAWFQTV